MFTLLFLATVTGTPAQLGTYQTEQSCNAAIRTIYETRVTPRGTELTPKIKAAIHQTVDMELQFQRDYKCVAQNEKDKTN